MPPARAGAIPVGRGPPGNGEQYGDQQQKQGEQENRHERPFVQGDEPVGRRRGKRDVRTERRVGRDHLLETELAGLAAGRRLRLGAALDADGGAQHGAEVVLDILAPVWRRRGHDFQPLQKLGALGGDGVGLQAAGLPLQPDLRGQRGGEKQQQQDEGETEMAGDGLHAGKGSSEDGAAGARRQNLRHLPFPYYGLPPWP